MAAPSLFWHRPASLPIRESSIAVKGQWRRRPWRWVRRPWRWVSRGAPPTSMLTAPSLLADRPTCVPVRVTSVAIVRQLGVHHGGGGRLWKTKDNHDNNQTQQPDAAADEKTRVVDLLAGNHVELPGAKANKLVVRFLGVVATTTHICHDRRAGLHLASTSASASTSGHTPARDGAAAGYHAALSCDHRPWGSRRPSKK